MEEVLHRDVGQLERNASDKTCGTPAERELHLVVGLRLKVVDDIYGSILGVGHGTWIHLLGIEMSCLSQLACRTDEVGLREEFTRAGT